MILYDGLVPRGSIIKEEIYSGANFIGDAENKLIKSISQLNSPFHDRPIRDSIMVNVAILAYLPKFYAKLFRI